MKKTLLIFLLFITMLIFAEEKKLEKEFKIKDIQSYDVIEPYSGYSSVVTPSYEGQRGYYNIALGFAQIGDYKSALKYAKKIEEQRDIDDCYLKIVLEMTASGFDDKALTLKTVKKIKEERVIKLAYRTIIESVIANDHDYEKAMLYANKYQDEHSIKSTKGFLISDMLKNNKVEDAITFYKMNIPDKKEKSRIFETVASVYLDQNDLKGLNDFMKKADISMTDDIKQMIISHASRMNKTYLIEDLLETLNDKTKDREYVRIASRFINKYKYSEAYEILTKIQDVENQDKVYIHFAQNYINDGNINRALSYADTMSTIKMRDRLYGQCIKSLLRFGDIDKAISLLHKTNDISTKEKIASDIAVSLFINEEMERYQEIVETISDSKVLDKMYRQIIQKLLRRNQYEQIEEYLEKITHSIIKDNALSTIAETYSRSNDFEKALKYAERIIDDDIRNIVLDSIKVKK